MSRGNVVIELGGKRASDMVAIVTRRFQVNLEEVVVILHFRGPRISELTAVLYPAINRKVNQGKVPRQRCLLVQEHP